MAFFFTSEDEAFKEAGAAVPEDWASARSTHRGIASFFRGLLASGVAPPKPVRRLSPFKRALQTWDELWRKMVAGRTDAKALEAHF